MFDGETKKAPNEANSCDAVCTAQHHKNIEVPTNSGGVSGRDGCQTKPILQTKPIAAGAEDGGGILKISGPLQ